MRTHHLAILLDAWQTYCWHAQSREPHTFENFMNWLAINLPPMEGPEQIEE